MWKDKGRAVIYEMAGIYLLVKSVNLFQNRAQSVGGEYIFIWIFIVLFLLAGIALIGSGLYMIKKHSGTSGNPAGEVDDKEASGEKIEQQEADTE